MNKTTRFLVSLLLVCSSAAPLAAQQAVVRGRVIDAQNGLPLELATVIDKQQLIGTSTDEDGYYRLAELDSGRYLLEVAYLGYQKQTRQVTVGPADTVVLDFGLVPLNEELAGVEITAQGHDLLNEPMPITTLAPAHIERLGATNTAELLEDIGGVSVARAGNWGSKPYLQGFTDSRVLMFIDGIKTTQACPMGMDACTATIEPDMINSMEVQVGSGSSEYGSGNMGGVINVSTFDGRYRNYEKFTADATAALRYKSVSDSRTWAVGVKGGQQVFDFNLTAGGGLHDNYKVPDADNYTFWPQNEIVPSGFGSNWLNFHLRWRPGKGHHLAFITQQYVARDIGWPSRDAATFTIIPNEKRQLYALKYDYETDKPVLKKTALTLAYQPMFHDMVNHTPGNVRFEGLSYTDNYQATGKVYLAPGKRHFITLGAEGWVWNMYAERRMVNDTSATPYRPILNNGQMIEGGLFVLDRLVVNQSLTLDLGLRINQVFSTALPTPDIPIGSELDDNNFIWSGNVAAVYKLNKYLSLTGSLVRGYNAATPVDRFISAPMPDGFYHFGNPALLPETSFNKRVGLRGMYNKWQWNLEYYHNNVNNLIQRAVDSTLVSPIAGLRGVKRAVNITAGFITGINLYAAYYLTPRWQLAVNTSWLYGADQNGNPLPNIAPLEITPKLTYENPDAGLWLTLRSEIATEQSRYAPEFAELYTPGYAVFDLNGGWRMGDHVELSAGISNFTNRYYRKHLNQVQLPEPGLNVTVAAKFTLPVAGGKRNKPNLKYAKLVTLKIDGMACQFCVNTVTERTEALPQVIQTVVNLGEGQAKVIVGRNISLDKLIETIQRAGFSVQVISVEPYDPVN